MKFLKLWQSLKPVVMPILKEIGNVVLRHVIDKVKEVKEPKPIGNEE